MANFVENIVHPRSPFLDPGAVLAALPSFDAATVAGMGPWSTRPVAERRLDAARYVDSFDYPASFYYAPVFGADLSAGITSFSARMGTERRLDGRYIDTFDFPISFYTPAVVGPKIPPLQLRRWRFHRSGS